MQGRQPSSLLPLDAVGKKVEWKITENQINEQLDGIKGNE